MRDDKYVDSRAWICERNAAGLVLMSLGPRHSRASCAVTMAGDRRLHDNLTIELKDRPTSAQNANYIQNKIKACNLVCQPKEGISPYGEQDGAHNDEFSVRAGSVTDRAL